MPLYLNGKRIAPTKLVYSGGYETYTGNYTINPATTNVVLSTTNKLLTQNITVNAMPSLTLPTETSSSASSGYTEKATISRSTSDRYINIETGYNSSNTYYKISAVPDGTAGTPVATKGSVSNNSISITPSVTNTTGYITGSTKTGTAVSVTASELVSGTLSITSNGTKDVTNYKNVNVQIGSDVNNQDKTISPTTSEQVITADSGYSGLGTVTINAMPSGTVTSPTSISGSSATVSNGTNTITLTKTISVTPNVTTAGYISSGTAGNSSVSLTASVTTKGAATYTPTTSTQTIAAGTYLTGKQTISGDANLIAVNIRKNVSIFGVTGTYEPPAGDTINNQDKTVTPTESEQSISADSGYTGLGVVTVEGISTTYVGSDIARRSASSLTASDATVTVPAGYYSTQVTKSVTSGTAGTPSASKGTVSNHSISVTPSVTNTTGYITGGTKNGTAVTVSASELVSGNKSISSNGTNIDVTNYATVSVAVPTGSTISNQDKNVTPTESEQEITADDGYTGLGTVTVGAISSTYVGSGITSRDSDDLTTNGATVNVPAGYYSAGASKSVATMTLPTSAAASATTGYTSKATISRSTSDQYINIAPGYNSAGGYYKISAVANGSATAPASISGSSASITTGSGTLTLTKTISVTPSVTAGYISSGTAGNSSVSLTASVTTKAAATYYPSTSNQTIAASQYLTGVQTIAAVTTSNLTAANIASGVTIKVGDSSDDDRITSITGTFTNDATATAADIVEGETAYVSGRQVTGTLVINNYYTGSSAPSSSLGSNGDIYIQQ